MSDNVSTVMEIYAAFGRGDVAWILDQLADDVSWDEHLRDTGLPYLAPGRGKDHVLGFFGHLAANFQIDRFEPGPICDGGDAVTVPLTVGGRIVDGGDVPPNREAHEWVFDAAGRVAEFRHILDLALHERAVAERSIVHEGHTFDAAGLAIEVLQAGRGFEAFRTAGAIDCGPPPHAHGWSESYYGLDGSVEMTIDGVTSTLSPGDFAMVPAGTTHSFRISSPTATFLVMSSGAGAAAFFADLDANVPSGPIDEHVLPKVIEVMQRHGVRLPAPA